MNKTCKKCNEVKVIEEFVKDKKAKDGYRNHCKVCENLKRRKTPIPPKPKKGYKFCASCKQEKTLDEYNVRFILNKYRPYSYCKSCEQQKDSSRYNHECKICGKEYKSGRRNSTYCKKCHDEHFIKTYSKLNTYDWSGENNPMYGVQRFGDKNPNYNPDLTDSERERLRLYEGYGVWRKQVYERDKYTCQCCGSRKGGTLNAHHLDGYNWCEEKRTDVNNGVTLCETCHKKFHMKYGIKRNTKEQFTTYKSRKEYLL